MLKKLHGDNYQEYLDHQKSKLDTYLVHDRKREALDDLAQRHYDTLSKRLQPIKLGGKKVLCLGARLGQEVQAFRDLGAFAVGIDLNPGPENEFVHYGDFHNIRFPDHVVDIIYTNSIDHTFDIQKMVKEMLRVLKLDGTLILEIQEGSDFGVQAEQWEACWWDSIDDVIYEFEKAGFHILEQYAVHEPFRSRNVTMTPLPEDKRKTDK